MNGECEVTQEGNSCIAEFIMWFCAVQEGGQLFRPRFEPHGSFPGAILTPVPKSNLAMASVQRAGRCPNSRRFSLGIRRIFRLKIPRGQGGGGTEMKMYWGEGAHRPRQRGLCRVAAGVVLDPGRNYAAPLFSEIGRGTVLLAWGVPPAPYKKKSPALLEPGIPDPNAYESFFSFRQHKPACKSRYLPSAFIVLGI